MKINSQVISLGTYAISAILISTFIFTNIAQAQFQGNFVNGWPAIEEGQQSVLIYGNGIEINPLVGTGSFCPEVNTALWLELGVITDSGIDCDVVNSLYAHTKAVLASTGEWDPTTSITNCANFVLWELQHECSLDQ